MNLNTPIGQLKGIGPAFLKRLEKLGIRNIKDLLFYFPYRYEDFSDIRPIAELSNNQSSCVQGRVLAIKTTRTWKKKMFLTEAVVEDKSGAIKAVWFNQPYITKNLKKGDSVSLVGKTSRDKKGLYLSNPVYEKKLSGGEGELTHTGRIISVYPETEGISSRWLRYTLKPLLNYFQGSIPEILPKEILQESNFPEREEALWQIHFPDSLEEAERARERFSFEQLFLIEMAVIKEKLKLNKEKAAAIPINVNLIKRFVDSLPFKLTDAQRKCAWQILKDLEKNRPMSRLLEGDVGSGKTLVAVIAALNTVRAGYQVVFMTPTEILAKQHFREISKLLAPFKIKIALLTGKEDKTISQKIIHKMKDGLKPEVLEISRRKLLEKARQGDIKIIIGTHTLIQDKVKFSEKEKGLALCIIDEQHRFGVEQRTKLVKRKYSSSLEIPHLLSMTATPIPRTLALTIYGDLDFSLLDEMPTGRKKIITKIALPKERDKAYQFIRDQVVLGNQAFVICPRIEASKKEDKEKKSSWDEVKAVKEEYEKLDNDIFPDLRVAMLHGKMKTKERNKIMLDFKNKKIDILVATSVVEVGVDIPQATVMVIEGAERFGLAQLHQFRGRVGRSDQQAYCFLFSDSNSQKTHQRLRAIVKAEDGFQLAQKDLEIRGPGSLYGLKQWGIPDLAMKNLGNLPLVEKTREKAKELLREDSSLKDFPLLKRELAGVSKSLHLE